MSKNDDSATKVIYRTLVSKKDAMATLWPSRDARVRNAQVTQVINSVTQACRENAKLRSCPPEVIMGAVYESVRMGFVPAGPDQCVSLVPFASKQQGMRCQFMLTYRGKMELLRRTGTIKRITPVVVRAGDYFRYQDFPRDLKHVRREMAEFADESAQGYIRRKEEELGPKADELRAVYCVFEDTEGKVDFSEPMLRHQVLKRAQLSRSSVWNEWEEEMWKKTALHAAVKYLPMSVQDRTLIERATSVDEHVVRLGQDGKTTVEDGFPDESEVPDVPEAAPPTGRSAVDDLVEHAG